MRQFTISAASTHNPAIYSICSLSIFFFFFFCVSAGTRDFASHTSECLKNTKLQKNNCKDFQVESTSFNCSLRADLTQTVQKLHINAARQDAPRLLPAVHCAFFIVLITRQPHETRAKTSHRLMSLTSHPTKKVQKTVQQSKTSSHHPTNQASSHAIEPPPMEKNIVKLSCERGFG